MVLKCTSTVSVGAASLNTETAFNFSAVLVVSSVMQLHLLITLWLPVDKDSSCTASIPASTTCSEHLPVYKVTKNLTHEILNSEITSVY